MNNNIETIYVDMDGVLTNFDKQFSMLNKQKLIPEKFIALYGEDKFWDLITKKGILFWESMEWLPGGKTLIKFLINNFNPKQIQILTTPSYENDSKIGKYNWVNNNLNGMFTINYSFNKEEYATSNNILIDDRESNIQKWIDMNGIGILHKDVNSTITQLKQYLNMKKQTINEAKWKLVIDLMDEWEIMDDSTDDLYQTDSIDKDKLNQLIDKIKTFEPKLSFVDQQQYNIVMLFLEKAKNVDQFEHAWDKFIEFMLDNNIYVKTFRTNNDKQK